MKDDIAAAAERYRRQCNDELAHGIYVNGLEAHVQKFRDQETLANAYASPLCPNSKFPNYDAMLVYCINAMHDTRDALNDYHLSGLQKDCDRVEAAASRLNVLPEELLRRISQSPTYADITRELAEARAENRQVRHELDMVRSVARQDNLRAEDADQFESWLLRLGKLSGCEHVDEQLPNCIEDAYQEMQDQLTEARAKLSAIATLLNADETVTDLVQYVRGYVEAEAAFADVTPLTAEKVMELLPANGDDGFHPTGDYESKIGVIEWYMTSKNELKLRINGRRTELSSIGTTGDFRKLLAGIKAEVGK